MTPFLEPSTPAACCTCVPTPAALTTSSGDQHGRGLSSTRLLGLLRSCTHGLCDVCRAMMRACAMRCCCGLQHPSRPLGVRRAIALHVCNLDLRAAGGVWGCGICHHELKVWGRGRSILALQPHEESSLALGFQLELEPASRAHTRAYLNKHSIAPSSAWVVVVRRWWWNAPRSPARWCAHSSQPACLQPCLPVCLLARDLSNSDSFPLHYWLCVSADGGCDKLRDAPSTRDVPSWSRTRATTPAANGMADTGRCPIR
jgi:hypothetical protein